MFKEKAFKNKNLGEKLIDDIFHSEYEFRKKVKECLSCGDYNPGTDNFVRQVIGPHYSKYLKNEEFAIIKRKTIKMISKINEDGKKMSYNRTKRIIREAEKMQWKEERRTGIHPEDLNIS